MKKSKDLEKEGIISFAELWLSAKHRYGKPYLDLTNILVP
jgi:hypothetical protein